MIMWSVFCVYLEEIDCVIIMEFHYENIGKFMPSTGIIMTSAVNTLRPKQNGRHFADDSIKCIFLNEHIWISIEISLKFVPKGPNNNIPALVQIMAWRRPGDKLLSEPMMVTDAYMCNAASMS